MTDFLLGALVLPEPEAAEAWRRWRGALDFDALTYESQQLIPALAARLPRWLEQDPCAARLQGIVKMVWSRNQLRFRRAAEVRDLLLQQAGAPSVVVGPLAWSMVTREEGAIRFIPYLSLLISREHLVTSASALTDAGWEMEESLPHASALDWVSHVSFQKDDDVLHLHWRLVPAPEGGAAACEQAFLKRTRMVASKLHEFGVLSAEADLLHRLASRPHWDPLPWQADVLMTPFDQVNWTEFVSLLGLAVAADMAEAVERLMDLRRKWALPVPHLSPPPPRPGHNRFGRRARVLQLFRRISARGRLLWKS